MKPNNISTRACLFDIEIEGAEMEIDMPVTVINVPRYQILKNPACSPLFCATHTDKP